MNSYGFRRKWMDGRTGHSIYLMFALTFTNFILIAYRFLIERDYVFEEMFSSLWIFAIIFIITYIPISIGIGFIHRKTQMKMDMTIKNRENPFFAKMFRIWLDTETEKVQGKEIKEFEKILSKIIKKYNFS